MREAGTGVRAEGLGLPRLPGAWGKDAEQSRVSRAGRCLPGRGWLGARTSHSYPEQGCGHLGASIGKPALLQEWKQGEVGALNLQTVGFTKNLVSNLTGERCEDAKDALALISPKDLVKPAGNAQQAAWAGKACEAGGGFQEFT